MTSKNTEERVVARLLSDFRNSTAFLQAEEHRRSECAADRADQIANEGALAKQQREDWVSNSTAFNKAAVKLESAKKQLDAAETEWRQAYIRRRTVNASYENQRKRIQGQLRETAPAVIQEARAWFLKQNDRARDQGPETRYEKTGRQDYAGNDVLRVLTNRKGWEAHRQALMEAYRSLEGLEVSVPSHAEAVERIDQLRAAIPPIGPLVATEGEMQ